MRPRIGTAGWTIPRPLAQSFPGEGSHLERYARCFTAAEINSSFHRPHRPTTYARWAASVPDGFRFAVKLPREITHTRKLVDAGELLGLFLDEVAGLGDRLGPLLVQLPPSLVFEALTVVNFFSALRERHAGLVACEPRHPSWFAAEVDVVLTGFGVARVAADPARVPDAARPSGWPELVYRRLHGSPRVYYSSYGAEFIAATADAIGTSAVENWCVFDNTASGAAAGDALCLSRMLAG